MILHRNNETTYLEKIGTTYIMCVNGWYSGAFGASAIRKDAKEHGRNVNDEAIAFFKKIIGEENKEKIY